jgi:hypothetical protein
MRLMESNLPFVIYIDNYTLKFLREASDIGDVTRLLSSCCDGEVGGEGGSTDTEGARSDPGALSPDCSRLIIPVRGCDSEDSRPTAGRWRCKLLFGGCVGNSSRDSALRNDRWCGGPELVSPFKWCNVRCWLVRRNRVACKCTKKKVHYYIQYLHATCLVSPATQVIFSLLKLFKHKNVFCWWQFWNFDNGPR